MTDFKSVSGVAWPKVCIIGGGDSLRGRDLSQLHTFSYVVGVNRAADFWPVDATFTMDATFLKRRRDSMELWAREHHVWACIQEDQDHDPIPGVNYIKRVQGKGLISTERRRRQLGPAQDEIVCGLNSGYGAVHWSVLKQAKEIYLLGFDLDQTAPADHWHDGYEWNMGSTNKYYGRWALRFHEIAHDAEALGVKIYNANPESKIIAFPKLTYEELGCVELGL